MRRSNFDLETLIERMMEEVVENTDEPSYGEVQVSHPDLSWRQSNHEPKVGIIGPLNVSARPGETVLLRGTVSYPDGDAVTLQWWQYVEADSYPDQIALTDSVALATSLRVPADAASGSAIHLILQATDNGTPALTRYQRVIVSVTR